MIDSASSGRERLDAVFARTRARGRGAFIPYVCAGDPDLATTARVLAAIDEAGVDLIELGVPYGDPLADGPTIAAAAQRAVRGGTTVGDVIALARAYRADGGRAPILFFTYLNPILQYGLERFAREAAAAGACGAIVPDLPIEEADDLRAAFAAHGGALPQLVAPSTPLGRATRLARESDGFVYLVSRLGVTSAADEPDLTWIASRVAALRAVTSRPIAVGFGISRPEHVRAVLAVADGAIVGSKLVEVIARSAPGDEAAAAGTYVRGLLDSCIAAS